MGEENLHERIKQLEAENILLKRLLAQNGITFNENVQSTATDKTNSSSQKAPTPKLSTKEKVALFRSLFRGREDVFARRWHSMKDGREGYQPVCANEWRPGVCDKKKYNCAACPNRQLLPLTDKDIYNHLKGDNELCKDVVGVYAILPDDTCYFLCSDFDDKNCEHGYQKDVLAFTSVCKDWGIPYSIERSRSGNGAHVWILFEQPVAAGKARKLGDAILTEAMNRDGRMTFKSYDRFFPNQDHLPEGGFGNLVALPLQGQAVRKGKSVFVDENFEAYFDQLQYLLSIRKINEPHVDALLQAHSNTQEPFGSLSKSSESKPWETPAPLTIASSELPEAITLVRANMIYIPVKDLPPKVINHLKRVASFKNPEFFSHLGLRLSTYNIPRIISCAELSDDYLALPRGCEESVVELFTSHNVKVTIEDKTNHGRPISVQFNGKLRDEQQEAETEMLKHYIGVLSATTAFGKTVTAIGMIAQVHVNTLILIHSKALLKQWIERLQQFLTINEEPLYKKYQRHHSPVGHLYSGKNALNGIIDIALIQSCISDNEVKPFIRDYGMIIVDECHHVSASGFEQVLKYANAQRVYGLTATPIRKDGHQPIIFMQCGAIRYNADAQQQMSQQSFSRRLIPRFTSFRALTDEKQTYMQLIHDLAADKLRNQLIVQDVTANLLEGRTPLVLSHLTEHVETLAQMLSPVYDHVIVLIGSKSAKERRKAEGRLQSISPNEPMVILSTDKYMGEGFDYPRLDTLFMTLPISWKENVKQCVGRLHRDYKGKTEVRVYDYIDIRIPLGDVMYKRRMRGYKSVGYIVKDTNAQTEVDNDNVFFNGNGVLQPFLADIANARQSIIVACSQIKLYRHPIIAQQLMQRQAEGIEVLTFIGKEGCDEQKLRDAGLQVNLHSGLTLQCAIFDKSLYWYGDINYLGYISETGNAMRIDNAEIASELLDIILDDSSMPRSSNAVSQI